MDRILLFAQAKGGIVLLTLLAFLLLERLFPAVRALGGLRRVGRNLTLAGMNGVVGWAVVVPVSAAAALWAWDWRPSWLGGWLGLGLDLLLLDFWIYWWHRLNHRWPLLWRFHEVHHLDEFLDASSALRFHAGEVLLSALVRALVIVVASVPLASVVVFETMLAVAVLFHHSNLRLPRAFERVLSLVIVTPSIHWVHHHATWTDTDSNYSTVLSVWDRLFGSRSANRRVVDMAIGVEGHHEEPLVGLLKRPFLPVPARRQRTL
jgi:sterol desaturase/sphingolipid hydroxylase (fatty acid hydroxylase superfamily)